MAEAGSIMYILFGSEELASFSKLHVLYIVRKWCLAYLRECCIIYLLKEGKFTAPCEKWSLKSVFSLRECSIMAHLGGSESVALEKKKEKNLLPGWPVITGYWDASSEWRQLYTVHDLSLKWLVLSAPGHTHLISFPSCEKNIYYYKSLICINFCCTKVCFTPILWACIPSGMCCTSFFNL